MKYFVFSDVHGDYKALMKAIEKYGYDCNNDDHTLVSCGDNFGRAERGEGSRGIYKYLTSPIHRNKPICLRGNHELILKDILIRRDLTETDIYNGEDKTIRSFIGLKEWETPSYYDINSLCKGKLMEWINSLPLYFETEHYIFLHGFLPLNTETQEFYTSDFSSVTDKEWYGAVWAVTPQCIEKFRKDFPHGIGKTIVFGHWHAIEFNDAYYPDRTLYANYGIWKDEELGLCDIDCCVVCSGRIDMLVVED